MMHKVVRCTPVIVHLAFGESCCNDGAEAFGGWVRSGKYQVK